MAELYAATETSDDPPEILDDLGRNLQAIKPWEVQYALFQVNSALSGSPDPDLPYKYTMDSYIPFARLVGLDNPYPPDKDAPWIETHNYVNEIRTRVIKHVESSELKTDRVPWSWEKKHWDDACAKNLKHEEDRNQRIAKGTETRRNDRDFSDKMRELHDLRTKAKPQAKPLQVMHGLSEEYLSSFESHGDGKYKISPVCMLTSPCQHHVLITETQETALMDGVEIYNLLDQIHVHDEHFDIYADTARNRTGSMTDADRIKLEEYEQLEKQHKQEVEDKRNAYKRNLELGKTTGSSSRLARLRSQNISK